MGTSVECLASGLRRQKAKRRTWTARKIDSCHTKYSRRNDFLFSQQRCATGENHRAHPALIDKITPCLVFVLTHNGVIIDLDYKEETRSRQSLRTAIRRPVPSIQEALHFFTKNDPIPLPPRCLTTLSLPFQPSPSWLWFLTRKWQSIDLIPNV